MAIDSREKRAAVVALGLPFPVLPAPDGVAPPARERWQLAYSYLLPTALPLSGRVRVEVYDGDGNKLSVGPIVEVTALQYGEGVDREGSFSLAVPATAGGADGLEVGQRLRFYREGEGLLPVVGIVETLEWGSGTDEARTLTVSGPSLSHELTWVNTGMNRVLTSRTPAQAVSDLLEGTGWTAGTVDSSALTLSRRYDGASVAAALVDAARYFGFHVRFHDLTRTVDFGVLGESTGQVFANMEVVPAVEAPQEVLPITGIRVSESAAELWNRIIVVGAGEGWGRATMITTPATQVALNHWGKYANGAYTAVLPYLRDDQNYDIATTDPLFNSAWALSNATRASSSSDVYDGNYCMVYTTTGAGVIWGISLDWGGTDWPGGAGSLNGHTVTFESMIQGRGGAPGKVYSVFLQEWQGAALIAASSVSFTASAAWQLVRHELTLSGAASTFVRVIIQTAGLTAAVGDALAYSRTRFWDRTALPYQPEHAPNAGGETEYFVEDADSVAEHGRRTRVLVAKAVYPEDGALEGHQAATVALARIGGGYLGRHKDPVVSGSFETVGLHRGIAYPVPVGDTARVRWSGVTADGYGGSREAFKAIDETFYLLSYRRSLGESGEDGWAFEGATVDEYRQAFEEQFVTVQSAVQDIEQQSDSGKAYLTAGMQATTVTAGAWVNVALPIDTDFARLTHAVYLTFAFVTGPNSAAVMINNVDKSSLLSGGPWNTAGVTYTVDITPVALAYHPGGGSVSVGVKLPTTTSVLTMSVVAEVATGNLD